MSPRTPSPIHHHEHVERRRQIAVEVVANAMLAMLVKNRLAQLDAEDRERAAADEQAHREAREAARRGLRRASPRSASAVHVAAAATRVA